MQGLWERSISQGLDPSLTSCAMAFDPISFCKVINKDGRAYQYRAMELIKFCRTFSTASEQSCRQVVRIIPDCVCFLSYSDVVVSVLKACDAALDHAVRSRDKRPKHTDLEIEKAERKLYEYERDFHAK